MTAVITAVAISIVAIAVVVYSITHAKKQTQAARDAEAERDRMAEKLEETKASVEAEKRELRIQAKEAKLKAREKMEDELKQARAEISKKQNRLDERQSKLDSLKNDLEQRKQKLETQKNAIQQKQKKAEKLLEERREELERVAAMSKEEARELLLSEVKKDAREDAAELIRNVQQEAKATASRKAAKIVTTAIQRTAVDQTTDSTVSVVPLPSDDMKGRVIGRQGRNIRCFEKLTGVDLIVDDTPEAVVLSGFDPIRREVARVALESLLADGRIHPGRIEETVERARSEIQERIQEAAEQATMDTSVSGLHNDLMRLLGTLKFRTSFGQNVLQHSIEVAHLAGMMADEVGARVHIARRGGLLHDIGKAVDHKREGTHTQIGAEIAKARGESQNIIHCVKAHHNDVEIENIEAALVQAADAISAARPGARRETLETYVNRLESLENLAGGYDGVNEAYAIQAGREVRVIVEPNSIDDLRAQKIAKGIACRVETELEYPGQIRVTVIRETRSIEYAK